jgi:hypothetical protein
MTHEPTGEERLLRLVNGARRGRTDEQIELDVEQIIKGTWAKPDDGVYFDHEDGWIVPRYSIYNAERDVHLRTLRRRDEE